MIKHLLLNTEKDVKWLNKYDNGGKKKFLEPNDKKLPSGRIHPFYYQPSSELAQSIGGEEGEPAYLIPTFKYGHPLDNPLEEYKRTGEHLGGPFKTWQEADEWDKTIRHPYVEKNEALPSPLKRWGKDYQNGGEMRYYQHGLDFKPKMISQNGSVIAKNDATYASPYIDPNRVQDIRQELDDKYFDYNNYLSQANKYLSRPTFSNSVLKPKDIADASHEYYQKTGFKMPLSFLLTQAQQETKLGTQLKSKNNIFNIGNTTEGKTKDFDSPKESIDAYLELIHKDYLNQGDRSLDDLLKPKSFVNSQGHRYAKDPKYEKKLTNQMQFVNNFLQQKKDGGAIIKDNLGYWNPDNWGKPVEIDSPNITMRNVPFDIEAVSNSGERKILKANSKGHVFKGTKVTEYPIGRYGINELHQLQDFTNKPSTKNWLNKYTNG